MTLRIATRKSALALWQAEHVRGLLASRDQPCALLPLSTEGDRITSRPLSDVGGKGLFIKELERALADGRADLAVHSAKDVPFSLETEFILSAFPLREDPRDALVAPFAKTFSGLKRGARVGTSSLRRAVQLLAARPDLSIVPVRGNVQTRLARATGQRGGKEAPPAERLDAVVLALAGLRRLGLEDQVTEVLPVELCLPAAGQGALVIEAVRGARGASLTAPLDDAAVSRCVRAERAVLSRLSGGCTVPVAAYATLQGDELFLRAALGGPDGRGGIAVVRAEARGTGPEALGTRVAEALLEKGGEPLLAAARSHSFGLPAPKPA